MGSRPNTHFGQWFWAILGDRARQTTAPFQMEGEAS
jgi:hypothetical protein